MYRSIIVARIRPNMQQSVAKVFAESDATSLPHDLGVVSRSLYSLNDVYLHVIDMKNEPGEKWGLEITRQITYPLIAKNRSTPSQP